MRSTILGLVVGVALAAASALPALACPYSQTNASNDEVTVQQTAQADSQGGSTETVTR
jgi:hypothetical protein